MKQIIRTASIVLLLTSLKAAEQYTSVQSGGAKIGSEPVPRIQFETNVFDFGTLIAVETLSGKFRFKNTGDAILKTGTPGTSCDCTEAKIKPDTLAPGESGELTFTIKLERALNAERHIMVPSNDPKNPLAQLALR